jgi:hypothetical protein
MFYALLHRSRNGEATTFERGSVFLLFSKTEVEVRAPMGRLSSRKLGPVRHVEKGEMSCDQRGMSNVECSTRPGLARWHVASPTLTLTNTSIFWVNRRSFECTRSR